jgi:hypothetical protein
MLGRTEGDWGVGENYAFLFVKKKTNVVFSPTPHLLQFSPTFFNDLPGTVALFADGHYPIIRNRKN